MKYSNNRKTQVLGPLINSIASISMPTAGSARRVWNDFILEIPFRIAETVSRFRKTPRVNPSAAIRRASLRICT